MIKKIIYLSVYVFFILSCKGNKSTIEITQNKNNQPVVVRLSKKYKKVFRIKIPIEIIIKNNSIRKKSFVTIQYNYGFNEGVIEFLYKKSNNKLVEIKNNHRKEIESFRFKNYVIYSSHKIDSLSSIQKEFKPYIEKMLAKNQDTLHIGTVTDFKQKHKELFERLTKKDSISIQLFDNDKLGERITVPVKWD